MTKTRSNEMKIEREKSYVWCLVGMSMRSAIWNQFWDPKWSQNGSQSAPKPVKWTKIHWKCFQNASRMAPSGVQMAFRVQFGVGNAPKARPHSSTQPFLDPKLVPKSTRKPSKIDLESYFATNSLSRTIWDRFSRDFRAVESKFLIQTEGLYLQSERDIRQNRIL